MNSRQLIALTVVLAGTLLLANCTRNDPAETAGKTEEQQASPEPKGTIKLSEESLKLVTIETITIRHAQLDQTLRAPGRISFDLNHTAKVTPTFEGRIAKMNLDVGQHVQAGDIVAVIDSPELLKPLELKAPVDGEIVQRNGTVGEMVDKTRELYTISQLTHVWVLADINATDIASVRAGQKAVIRTSAYPDEAFTGHVVLIHPEVDEKSRTAEARIEADNAKGRLKAGMFADVDIVKGTLDGVIVVPEEAIQRIDEQQILFVAADSNTFVERVVKTGYSQNGNVQILDGLNDGEHVVTKGSFLLKSEMLKSQFGE